MKLDRLKELVLVLNWWWYGIVLSDYQQRELPEGIIYFEQDTIIEKLDSDDNNYQMIRLSNGLEALLISNSKLVKASAALNVKAGSRHEPNNFKGLAHLCEHMLFLGNDKYPDNNEFDRFIKSSAGLFNAYTDFEETGYYFEINADRLEEGLDRFANMFIQPLFKYESVSNEVDILNQEFQSTILDDEIRYWHMLKSMGKESHPYTNHFRGNDKTLRVRTKPRKEQMKFMLSEFFDHHYSSDIMKLVVIGKESIDELVKSVVKKFSEIPNLGLQYQTPTDYVEPFEMDDEKLLKLVPIKDESKIIMNFKIPNQDINYESKPSLYLEYALCQSNTGSIISRLKSSQYAYNISCGVLEHYSDFGIFEIEYLLTPDGEEHIDQIVTLTMGAIETISEKWISEIYFNQFKRDLELTYNFYKSDVLHQVAVEHARILQLSFPPERILNVDHLLFRFDKDQIKNFIKNLNYDNLRVALITRNNKNLKAVLKVDPIFKTQYTIKPFKTKTINSLKNPTIIANLTLPDTNPYLPTQFKLLQDQKLEKPNKIIFESHGKLVHHNQHFNLPKAVIKTAVWINLINEAKDKLADHTKLELLKEIIVLSLEEDNHNNYFYQAGYEYSISVRENKMELSLTGFSDKIIHVQRQIINNLINSPKFTFLYPICQFNLIAKKRSALFEKPIDQVEQLMRYALKLNPYDIQQSIKVAQKITKEDMDSFLEGLFDRGILKVLVEGNLNKQDALDIYDVTLRGLELQELANSKEPTYTLPHHFEPDSSSSSSSSSSSYVYERRLEPNFTNFAIGYYLHLYDNLESYQPLSLILRSIMMDHIHRFMRIDSNTSYQFKVENLQLVNSGGGILFLLESSYDSRKLENQIENFISFIIRYVKTISVDQFEFKKLVVGRELNGLRRNLEALANLHWSEFLDKNANFDDLNDLLATLADMRPQDLTEFLTSRVTLHCPHRRKLSIHLVPQNYLESEQNLQNYGKIITELESWR